VTARALDDAALERLRQLNQDGQPDVVREVLTVFLADATHRLAAIDAGIGQQDGRAVHRAAHALKGAASSIGATTLEGHCRDLEAAAQAPALDRARETARHVQEEIGRVRVEIQRILAANEAPRGT
jgi:HPt (histidine-containing phosphotransfer) domain-containing protein